MPNSLVDVTVRQDWQEIAQQISGRHRRIWRTAQIAVLATTLFMVSTAGLGAEWAWLGVFGAVLFTFVLWLPPLYVVYRSVDSSLIAVVLRLLAASVLLLTGVVLTYATIPGDGNQLSWSVVSPVLIVPVITWSLVLVMRRRYPIPCRLLGMTFERWPSNVLVGAAAGLVLGLHLLLTSGWLLSPQPRGLPDPALLLWALSFRLGLSALGEELFFRGLGYRVIYDGHARSLLVTLAQVSLLNLLIFLVPILNSQASPFTTALLLAYGAAFGVTATLLRHTQRSLLPSLACNGVFGLFLIVLLVP